MKLTIEIESVNDAFAVDPDIETVRIIRQAADSIEGAAGATVHHHLYDINGALVGEVEFQP